MDKAITSEQASDFIKMLVELGGIHYVDADHLIRNSEDDSPVGVMTGIPPKRRPVAIFRTGMKVGDYVILNPFSDVMGNSPERALFSNWMMSFPGPFIKHIIMRMIEVGISKDGDTDYKATKYVSRWVDKMDEKLLEEADRIPGKEWGIIFYDRTKKTAQLQSNIGFDELKTQFKTKIRKASWPVFVDMLKTLLELSSNKKPEALMYESKLVSIPKIDAVLHLLIDILGRMEDAIVAFTDIEINVKLLKENVDQIEVYREATKWFASSTVSSDTDNQTTVTEVASPWKSIDDPTRKLTVAGAGSVSAMEEALTISRLQPAGVIINPGMQYNAGTPMYGSGLGFPNFGGAGCFGAGLDVMSQLRC